MNKKLGLAVAGAVMALSSAAQAGITIPAGDWTIDISGNVNAYYINTRASGAPGAVGAIATGRDARGDKVANGINTGLLPAWIGFTGKTRQNDLDVSWTISFQPAVSENTVTGDGAVGGGVTNTFLNRQTFLQFGDASWGSIKLGKDLGIFASDAILNDMTLLGVGAGSNISGQSFNTTLGGIGSGYVYAAWKGQIAYTTPNWNGFQATIALTNPNQTSLNSLYQDRLGIEGKASYAWTGDFSGKVWGSFASYDVQNQTNDYSVTAYDLGANVNYGSLGLTAYLYDGRGLGTTFMNNLGADVTGAKRDSNGGYLQATYVIPTGTKLGAAWGVSRLDSTRNDRVNGTDLVDENRRITIGAYHPLTKSLNLVAEYNDIRSEAQGYMDRADARSKNISLGAILFF
jgi:predicted porin